MFCFFEIFFIWTQICRFWLYFLKSHFFLLQSCRSLVSSFGNGGGREVAFLKCLSEIIDWWVCFFFFSAVLREYILSIICRCSLAACGRSSLLRLLLLLLPFPSSNTSKKLANTTLTTSNKQDIFLISRGRHRQIRETEKIKVGAFLTGLL